MPKVFEIKIKREWVKVRSTSMILLDEWCNEQGIKDWRMVGMQSRKEIKENEKLEIIV